jgi:hypothetical protein
VDAGFLRQFFIWQIWFAKAKHISVGNWFGCQACAQDISDYSTNTGCCPSKGSIAEGWLWVSTLKASAQSSSKLITRRYP